MRNVGIFGEYYKYLLWWVLTHCKQKGFEAKSVLIISVFENKRSLTNKIIEYLFLR